MQNGKSEKMKHMSFVLPKEERDAFRFLCVALELSPSLALRLMVRAALGGGYLDEIAKARGAR